MSENRDGFILVETLISLVLFSVIALSALNFFSGISSVIGRSTRSDLYEQHLRLSENPSLHRTNSSFRLLRSTKYEDGSVWRLYQYTSPEQESIEIPVYYPEGSSR